MNITNVFTFPRCGTHFIWGEFIKSKEYQLIYDADRIPALNVLSQAYNGELEFGELIPENPNYNFQYNSLVGWMGIPLSASKHLGMLREKYAATTPTITELFQRAIEAQDNNGKALLSINRFVYTMGYDFLFDGFEWTTEHALQACDDYLRLLEPYNTKTVLVIRRYPDWVKSRSTMVKGGRLFVEAISNATVTKHLAEKGVRIYYMDEVIKTIKQGNLEFWDALMPLPPQEIAGYIEQSGKDLFTAWSDDKLNSKTAARPFHKAKRVVQYLCERDDFRRLGLVRSLGTLPLRLLRFIPVLGKRLVGDQAGRILNNAKITRGNPGAIPRSTRKIPGTSGAKRGV